MYTEIQDFMEVCLKKFNQESKKGGKTTEPWINLNTGQLLKGVFKEVVELEDAFAEEDLKAIQGECVNVANFCWFLWQKIECLKEVDVDEKLS